MTGGTKLVPNPCHDQIVETEVFHQNPVEGEGEDRHRQNNQHQRGHQDGRNWQFSTEPLCSVSP